MPNPRLLINLLRGVGEKAPRGIGALKKVPREIPYRKWSGIESLDPSLSKRARFDGIQDKVFKGSKGEIETKPGFYQFTDKKTDSTFLVPLEEDINFGVWDRLQKLDKAFKEGGNF